MTDQPMTDEEAADFYADEKNQAVGGRVISRRKLSASIPVRFPPETVAAVKSLADSEGVSVSEWIRAAVQSAISASGENDEPSAIVEDLRRDLDRLSAKLA